MIKTVAVFGSCVSRDLFNSSITPNYKKYFKIEYSSQRQSLISLMNNPLEYDEKLIEITPKNPHNAAKTLYIKTDLEKTFLRNLIDNPVDVLVFDNNFEIRMGILILNDGSIITNNHWDLPLTKLYKKLQIKEKLSMENGTEKFLKLWKESCDSFLEFLEINCPDTQVVLNSARRGYKVLKKDGTIEINENFKRGASVVNKLWDQLDEYIYKNHNVDLLNFDENVLLVEDHFWGLAPAHYESKYYTLKLNELVRITNNKLKEEIKFLNNNIIQYKHEIYNFKVQLENVNNQIKDNIFTLNQNKNEINQLKECNDEFIRNSSSNLNLIEDLKWQLQEYEKKYQNILFENRKLIDKSAYLTKKVKSLQKQINK